MFGFLKKAVRSVVHNPVTRNVADVSAVATGGLLAPVALGLKSAALADNVVKHGPIKGLRKTASQELATKDPREVARATRKLLPKMVRDEVPADVLDRVVGSAVGAIPGGRAALDASRALRKALDTGKPEDIAAAAAAGLDLEGGQKLEHKAALDSLLKKLPADKRKVAAAGANAVTKLHKAAQGRIKKDAKVKQASGMRGLLIPFLAGRQSRGIKGKWRYGGNVKGFLLMADGTVRVGNFERV